MKYTSSTKAAYNHPVQKVWDALTIPEQVKTYFFGTNMDTDWAVGSPIFFRGEWEGKAYEDKGTVLSFNPSHELSYSYWSPMLGVADEPDNYQIVTYSLEENDGITTLTVTQSNVDSQEKADHSTESWKMLSAEMEKFLNSKAE